MADSKVCWQIINRISAEQGWPDRVRDSILRTFLLEKAEFKTEDLKKFLEEIAAEENVVSDLPQ